MCLGGSQGVWEVPWSDFGSLGRVLGGSWEGLGRILGESLGFWGVFGVIWGHLSKVCERFLRFSEDFVRIAKNIEKTIVFH